MELLILVSVMVWLGLAHWVKTQKERERIRKWADWEYTGRRT